jgi:hypothetical protein
VVVDHHKVNLGPPPDIMEPNGGVGHLFAISAGLVKIFNIASDIVCVRRVEDRGITRRR